MESLSSTGRRTRSSPNVCFGHAPVAWIIGADCGAMTAEELSEEDQQLKSELDMLVERLTVFSNDPSEDALADRTSRSRRHHSTNPRWRQ
jgi:hypothetical protein